MKQLPKILFVFVALLSVTLLFSGTIAQASVCPGYETSLVPCGQEITCRCELTDFFTLLRRIFDFIILNVMTPLAVLLFVVGGLLILLSGFNQSWYSWGRQMIYGGAIAVALILCSWLIINIFLTAIGYTGPWSSPFAP